MEKKYLNLKKKYLDLLFDNFIGGSISPESNEAKLLRLCENIYVNSEEIYDMLKTQTVDVNCKNNNDMTPLLLILTEIESEDLLTPVIDKIEIVKLLLDKGSSIDDPRLLFYALSNNDIVELLLKSGVPDNIKLDEKLPINIALEKKNYTLIEKLIQYGTKDNKIIKEIMRKIINDPNNEYDYEQLFKYLMDNYNSFNTGNQDFIKNIIHKNKKTSSIRYNMLLTIFVKKIEIMDYLPSIVHDIEFALLIIKVYLENCDVLNQELKNRLLTISTKSNYVREVNRIWNSIEIERENEQKNL